MSLLTCKQHGWRYNRTDPRQACPGCLFRNGFLTASETMMQDALDMALRLLPASRREERQILCAVANNPDFGIRYALDMAVAWQATESEANA